MVLQLSSINTNIFSVISLYFKLNHTVCNSKQCIIISFFNINSGMKFSASLTDNDTVSFKLRDAVEDRDVGITLELSRKILKGDGEAFLRMLASGREASICAGAAWRW